MSRYSYLSIILLMYRIHRFLTHSCLKQQQIYLQLYSNCKYFVISKSMTRPGNTYQVYSNREIHPLDPQPHRHSMLVPRVCAPQVTRCSLGKYWSRDFFQRGWQDVGWQAANPGVHRLSMTHIVGGSDI